MPLPNWLDNTLATLPSSHPVRRLVLPHDRPIMTDLVDHNLGGVEGAVFAFQAPQSASYPLDHAGSDGHSGVRVAATLSKPPILNSDLRMGTFDSHGNSFEVTHDESVEFQDDTFAGSHTVPFSTPGPGCAIPRAPEARCPRGDNYILFHTTDNGSQEAMDIPPPFSTPGPFASPQPISSHVFGNHPVAPYMLPEEVYPKIQKSSAVPILSSHTTKSDGISTSLFPVQDGRRQFSALPNLVTGFTFNNIGRLCLLLRPS